MDNIDIISRFAADKQRLMDYFRKLKIGETRTYEQISADCEIYDIGGHHSAYQAARRALQNEGIEIETLRGNGAKRATNRDCIEISDKRTKHIRSESRRVIKTIDNIPDPQTLTIDERATVAIRGTIAKIILSASKPALCRRLESDIANQPEISFESIKSKLLTEKNG